MSGAFAIRLNALRTAGGMSSRCRAQLGRVLLGARLGATYAALGRGRRADTASTGGVVAELGRVLGAAAPGWAGREAEGRAVVDRAVAGRAAADGLAVDGLAEDGLAVEGVAAAGVVTAG